MKRYLNFINNTWTESTSGKWIEVINPSSGEAYGELTQSNNEDIDLAIKSARKAFEESWGQMSAKERGKRLKKFAETIRKYENELTQIEVADVGKPVTQARADAIACANYFEYYGEAADKVLGETIPFNEGYTVLTLREAHGVTGHIVPWNYPMQIIGRSVAAALAMGNTCVIKPAEIASLSALKLAEIAKEAGLPAGAINIVTGLGSEVGAYLSAHAGLNHISFTGSNLVGQQVQAAAAKNTIPVTLELGGKSPQIVFEDADLEKALPFLVKASIQNAGQTCSAGSRVLIHEAVYEKVTTKLKEAFSKLTVGAADKDLDIGPVVSHLQQSRIAEMVEHAKKSGIDVLFEGSLVDTPENGSYVKPLIFHNVPAEHPIAQEEVFGPVMSIIKFKDEKEAIDIANGTKYGLVAGVWTENGSRAMRVARKIEAGQIFINNYGAAGGIELPFGGVKSSGHGREKGLEALYAFSAVKTIAIKHD